ncbi:MAG TPA: hypothetical protein VMU82_15240 [Acetobacteraceae bacterium]|nr:hypothetical protein [Acetobacteraceae bacterium]
MSKTPDRPKLTERARLAQAERDARLAAALRDNLRKRKAQSREKEEGGKAPPPGPRPAG